MTGRVMAVVTIMALTGAAQAETLRPPQNVNAEPSSSRSKEMSTRAADASMKNDPQAAIRYADKGIAANPSDPWPYYNKAEALARIGRTDEAVAEFGQAERRYAANDRWGRSVAIFGRAHALSEAGRCGEARTAFDEYVAVVKDDSSAVATARREAAECKTSSQPQRRQ